MFDTVRVFVNHVDAYSTKVISKILAKSVVGASDKDADDDDDDDERDSNAGDTPKEDCFKVVGTLRDPEAPKPDWVQEIFQYEQKEELLPRLLTCDVIIYDIMGDPGQLDEASWAVSAMNAEIDTFTSSKTFICISSAMTWARTKPVDPDDPEMPFTEEDYRKRKGHPNFKSHLSAEKLIIKLGKTNKARFPTYVIAAGLLYGEGENLFHTFFKAAWMGKIGALEVYGSGQNVLPTIHVRDLASIVVNVCDSKPKVRYILAVDDANSTLEDIVRSISKNLGTGKIKVVGKEDSLMQKEISQPFFDMLSVNLRMDSTLIKESMNINWVAETGLPDNIALVIKEFKEGRGLLPMRACIVGPPASGKTTVIKQLCEHYKLHHIKIKEVIDQSIVDLERGAARADEPTDEEEEDDMRAEDNAKMLESIAECKEKNNGRLDDEFVIQFYKDKLNSMPCQNQGFIMDGYPKTQEQGKQLFAVDDEEEEEEGKEELQYDKKIMPEFVICLTSSDDYLRKRIMNMPEKEVSNTHNTEDGFSRRLVEYRAINTEDETVLNYFDELEIHPEHIDITQDHTPDMRQTVDKIIAIMGKPRNYGPTPQEIADRDRENYEREQEEKRREQFELERAEAEEARERAKKLEEWRSRLNEVKRQELDRLELQSVPLRNYLMKNVMPTLTQGLMECCKVRPDDPVDFLAEYLFEHNPQINI